MRRDTIHRLLSLSLLPLWSIVRLLDCDYRQPALLGFRSE